jgi:hypothetical protein
MIVTQDGKLVVVAPAPNAAWKFIVVSAKPFTNASWAATNSPPK